MSLLFSNKPVTYLAYLSVIMSAVLESSVTVSNWAVKS